MTLQLRSPLPLIAAALAALLPLASHAQAPTEGDEGRSAWAAGLALLTENKAYRDYDDKLRVLPLLSFENRWVRLLGPGVELKLGRSGPLSYGLTASYARDGYDDGDSPFLAGMDKRRASAWVGGRLGLRTEFASLSAHWQADASSHSKGQKLRLGAERRLALGAVGLTPRIAATWLDGKFINYYYGVRVGEARANRAAYTPGSTVNTELGLRVDYRLAPQQTVFADVGVTLLGSAIKDSPLVDRRTLPELRLGWLYAF
jgi:outer membrane protein